MSGNKVTEEKWTASLRDDQCTFIVEAMKYIEARAVHSENRKTAFAQFVADRAKERAVEIRALIEEVTS